MKAVIYTRYSSDRQNDTSIEDQARNCRRFAEREGFLIIRDYQDKAISGTVRLRPEYQRMLEDALSGDFDILMVDDLSRLSRDDYEMKGLLRKLAWHNIRVIGVSDGYDSSKKGHKIHAGFKGLMNEIFIDDLRERVHRGMTGQAIKGFNCGGRTYGYRNTPIEDATRKDPYGRPIVVAVKYDIDDVQAAIVKQIHEWYAGGYSYKWIASELNRQRIPSSRGTTWAGSAIKVILENEMYEGRLIWNKRIWVKNPDTGKRTYKERPKEEWIINDNMELRIVPEPVINAIRKRQKRNTEAYGGLSYTPLSQRYLFSGILICAECGGKFTVTGQNRYGCATHKTRGTCENKITVSRHIVEERLLNGIRSQLLTPKAVERFKQAAVRALEAYKNNDQTEMLKRQLKDSQKERDNILCAIRAGIVTAGTKNALETAEASIQEMEDSLKQAARMNLSGILPRAVERYQAAINSLASELSGHASQAREIIKSLVGEQIKVHRRGEHLEAELENNMTAVFARVVGSDSVGCGGGIYTKSEYISLAPRLSDNTPLIYRKTSER